MDLEDLAWEIRIAEEMREKSYCPYSNFSVGCALVSKAGGRYSGCNIENGGIQSICAERVAFSNAIAAGVTEFTYMLILGGKKGEKATEECLPCGYCRQFIKEFVDKDFKIYSVDHGKLKEYTIDEILPHSFEL